MKVLEYLITILEYYYDGTGSFANADYHSLKW